VKLSDDSGHERVCGAMKMRSTRRA
jgi:hypothetical protein